MLHNHEVNALKAIMFSSFVPCSIDLYSAVLKNVIPNMKKKKSEEFDTLKSSVMKPSKALVSQIK
jgi:hypothetical protein